MLENMIVKLQTLTGGLRRGKSLHHFVFNGLDLILKHCLPLPFTKEPFHSGRRKGHRAGASKNGIDVSLEFVRALWNHSSHLCSPVSHSLPSLRSTGTPPASTGELAQPQGAHGFIPRRGSNALSRCGVSGLQLVTELPAGHSAQTSSEVAGRRGRLGQCREGCCWRLRSNKPPLRGAVFVVAGSSSLAQPGLCPQPRGAHPRRCRVCRATGKMRTAVSC